MARVQLLADDRLDFQGRRAVEPLQKSLAGEFEILRCDLRPGVAGIVNYWRSNRSAAPVDLTIAWGMRALTITSFRADCSILFSFLSFPTARQIRFVRAAMSYRNIHLICPTSTSQRFCLERGVPIERCHLVRPGVDFSRVRRRRDPQLRQALGLAEGEFVFLIPCEATTQANLRLAVWAVSILNVTTPKYRLLISGQGPIAESARRFAAKLNQPELLINAGEQLGKTIELDSLFCAADGVLITATGPVATLPIATCMAAGLPIVSTVTRELSELLEDRHTALLVTQPTPRAIAQRILDLSADNRLEWAISDMAKTEAFSYFAQSRFVDQYRSIVRQILAGEKVAVPEPAASAGLRFHGLA